MSHIEDALRHAFHLGENAMTEQHAESAAAPINGPNTAPPLTASIDPALISIATAPPGSPNVPERIAEDIATAATAAKERALEILRQEGDILIRDAITIEVNFPGGVERYVVRSVKDISTGTPAEAIKPLLAVVERTGITGVRDVTLVPIAQAENLLNTINAHLRQPAAL